MNEKNDEVHAFLDSLGELIREYGEAIAEEKQNKETIQRLGISVGNLISKYKALEAISIFMEHIYSRAIITYGSRLPTKDMERENIDRICDAEQPILIKTSRDIYGENKDIESHLRAFSNKLYENMHKKLNEK